MSRLKNIRQIVVFVARYIYRSAKKLRSLFAPFLHWNYSGGLGGTVLVSGVVMLLTTNAFTVAKLMIGIGGVWLMGWWLVSDHLLSARPADSCPYREYWNAHRLREWIPIVVSVCALCLLFRFADNSERDYHFSEVLSHLSIKPVNIHSRDPLDSPLEVVNNSPFDISRKHRIFCKANLEVGQDGKAFTAQVGYEQNTKGWIIWGGKEIPPLEDFAGNSPILANGDGQTDTCMNAVLQEKQPKCIDFTIIFQYELKLHPGIEQQKSVRIVGSEEKGEYTWLTQPLSRDSSYCSSFLKN